MIQTATLDNLTPRQRECYDAIVTHIEECGWPPTQTELAERLQVRSPNAAHEHCQALQRKGVIEITKGISRGIRVLVLPEHQVHGGEP